MADQPGTIASGPGVEHAGDLETRVARLENWINYLANYTALSAVPEPVTVSSTVDTDIGGVSVPWGSLRPLLQLPDARWDVWAAGLVLSTAASVTVELIYISNAGTRYVLGQATYPANAARQKVQLGPFQVRGSIAAAAGIPQNESIITFGIAARMMTAGSATLSHWTLWTRQSPTRS